MAQTQSNVKMVVPQAQVVINETGGSISNDLSYIMNIFYTSLIVVGIIVLLSTVGTYSVAGLNGMMTGYILIGTGLLLLVGYLLYNILNKKNNSQLTTYNRNTITTAFYTTGPFLMLIGIIGYTVFLLIKYKSRISEGNVAPGYASFTNIFVILILIQLFIFYFGTTNAKSNFKETGRLNKIYGALLYFVGIISIVTVKTLEIILSKFSTDG